jgi:hypothetical protein
MTESSDSKKYNKPDSLTFDGLFGSLDNTFTTQSARKWINREDHNEIPKGVNAFLTLDQQTSLELLSLFGWQIWFVRRISVDRPVVVMHHQTSGVHALLTEDGNLDMDPDFHLRNE